MDNPNTIKDERLCKSITASLGDIVRYSMNDNFRNSCFDLFNVESTKAMQEKIGESLNSFCKTNFNDQTPKKQSLRIQEILPQLENPVQLLEITPKRPSIQQNQHLMGSGNRNWLSIAAKQTRNTIRRQSVGSRSKDYTFKANFNLFRNLKEPLAISKTTTSFNLLPSLTNPNFLTFNSPDCSPAAACRSSDLRKPRKLLFLKNDDENN